jgi:hypothetical protein
MTMHSVLPIAPVSGLPPSYSTAEDNVLDDPDCLFWFDPADANDSLTGGKWYDRKNGYAATLVDPAKRPTETLIGTRPTMKTGASDPTAIWVTDDEVMPENGGSLFIVADNHGTSALASLVAFIGNNGNALGLRYRSSGIIGLGLDAGGAISGLSATVAATTVPHLIELGLLGSSQAYLYRDGASVVGTGAITGWTRQSRRLSFGGVYDLVTGVVAYGRTIGLGPIIGARFSALDAGTAFRAKMKALINERYTGLITVA